MPISLQRNSVTLTATLICDRCRAVILSTTGEVRGKDTLALIGPAVREHGARRYGTPSKVEIHCAGCVEGAGREPLQAPAAGQSELFGEVG